MEALLENGADLDAQDTNGETALVLASKESNTEIVHFLLNKGASTDSPIGEKALGFASGRGSSEIVQILLDRKVSVDATCDWNYRNEGTCTALIRALARQQYETADLLMTNGADINARSSMGDRDAVLLEHVIVNSKDLNLDFESSVVRDIVGGGTKQQEMFSFLIEHGADPKLVRTDHLNLEQKQRYRELLSEFNIALSLE